MSLRKNHAWDVIRKNAALPFPLSSFLPGTVAGACRNDSLQPAGAPLVTQAEDAMNVGGKNASVDETDRGVNQTRVRENASRTC